MFGEGERLGLRCTVGREPDAVGAGQDHRPVLRRAPEDHAGERLNRRRVEIPGVTVDAGGHRRALRAAAKATLAATSPGRWFLAGLRRRLSVDPAHHLALRVEELDREALGLSLQKIRDARTLDAADDIGGLVERDVAGGSDPDLP